MSCSIIWRNLHMINRPQNIQIKVGTNLCNIHYPGDIPFEISQFNETKYSDIKKFNYSFINFGDKFSKLRDTIDKNEFKTKLLKTLDNNFENEFQTIRKISNSDSNLESKDVDFFLAAYKKIFLSLNDLENYLDYDVFIVPLMGGGIISKLLNIDSKQVIALNAKRVPLSEEGSFALGLNAEKNAFGLIESQQDADEIIASIQDKKVCILEVCVASGITTLGFLIDLQLRNIKPKKLSIVSAVMSNQSVKLLSDEIINLELNYDIEFVTGKVLHKLLDFYNEVTDAIAYDNGDKAVISPADAYKFKYIEGDQ